MWFTQKFNGHFGKNSIFLQAAAIVEGTDYFAINLVKHVTEPAHTRARARYFVKKWLYFVSVYSSIDKYLERDCHTGLQCWLYSSMFSSDTVPVLVNQQFYFYTPRFQKFYYSLQTELYFNVIISIYLYKGFLGLHRHYVHDQYVHGRFNFISPAILPFFLFFLDLHYKTVFGH